MKCVICSNDCKHNFPSILYCSEACQNEAHDPVKQGIKKNKDGYYYTNADGLIHRKVCKNVHGSYPKEWIVHHVDGNKENNRGSNLIALPCVCHDEIHKVQKNEKRTFTREECEEYKKAFLNENKRMEEEINNLAIKAQEIFDELERRKKPFEKKNYRTYVSEKPPSGKPGLDLPDF